MSELHNYDNGINKYIFLITLSLQVNLSGDIYKSLMIKH